ncbi:MAG: hypothetical protein Roseis2KO_48470 [Roseivirga sp.]
MNKQPTFVLALLILTLFSCGETTEDTPLIKPELLSIKRTYSHGYENTTTFEYQAGRLIKKSLQGLGSGTIDNVYTYENGVLSSMEVFASNGDRLNRHEYSLDADGTKREKVYINQSGSMVLVSEFELIKVAGNEARLNLYSYVSGTREAVDYRTMTLSDGNVLRQESFLWDGTSYGVVEEWQRHEGLDPLKGFFGDVDFGIHGHDMSQNLHSYNVTKRDGEKVKEETNIITLNEFGLPSQVEVVLQLSGTEQRYTDSYIYK